GRRDPKGARDQARRGRQGSDRSPQTMSAVRSPERLKREVLSEVRDAAGIGGCAKCEQDAGAADDGVHASRGRPEVPKAHGPSGGKRTNLITSCTRYEYLRSNGSDLTGDPL